MKRLRRLIGLVMGVLPAIAAAADPSSSVESTRPSIVAQIKLQAGQGNRNAEIALGNMYVRGIGVPKDLKQAFKWYMQSAKQGEPDAQAYVGGMYLKGSGVERNFENALMWIRRSSDQGSAAGEYNLAQMYRKGFGTQDDQSKAKDLLLKSAAQHFPAAEIQLGIFAYQGDGEPVDHHRAMRLFLSAVYTDDLYAEYYIAKMYFYGDDVGKDNVVAYVVIKYAMSHVDGGDKSVVDQITDLQRRIEAKMSAKDFSDADKLLSDVGWQAHGLANVLGFRVYKATGKSLLGSDDPMQDSGIGPVVIDIDDKGVVSLFGRVIDITTLRQRLQTFFDHDPYPDIRIFVEGRPNAPSSSWSRYAVNGAIGGLKLRRLDLTVQQQ